VIGIATWLWVVYDLWLWDAVRGFRIPAGQEIFLLTKTSIPPLTGSITVRMLGPIQHYFTELRSFSQCSMNVTNDLHPVPR
jgi:hypothetical protein